MLRIHVPRHVPAGPEKFPVRPARPLQIGLKRKGTRLVRREAVQRVPKHTGRLRKSLKTRFSSAKLEGQVYSMEPHAHLVEFGARAVIIRPKRKKALRIPLADGYKFTKIAVVPKRAGKPFLKPAYDYVEPQIIQDVKKALRGT